VSLHTRRVQDRSWKAVYHPDSASDTAWFSIPTFGPADVGRRYFVGERISVDPAVFVLYDRNGGRP
jgi:hypothetical protein